MNLERLDDRITPDVRVFSDPALTIQVGPTFTGTTALYDAVQAGTTLDGHFVAVDAVNGSDYRSPGTIPKSLTLLGPNAGVSPNTGTRLPEVNVDTTPWAGAPAGYLSIADGKSLAVRGFSFTTAGGAGVITVFATGYAVDFSRNIVRNQVPVYGQVYFSTNLVDGYTSATVNDNLFADNDPDRTVVRISRGDNASVTNNVVLGGYIGVSLETSSAGGVNDPVVSNNYIAGTTQEGIRIGNFTADPVVTFNTVTNANTSNNASRGAIRIVAFSDAGAPGPLGDVVITNNLVTASNRGFHIGGGAFPPGVTGLFVRQNSFDVTAGTAVATTGNMTDATVDLSGNWLGSNVAATIEAGIVGMRPATVQAYLSGNANTRTGALSATSGKWGFIPDAATVQIFVPQRAAVSGLTRLDGVVQTGLNIALDGMTVRLDADTYTENVVVPGGKTLTVRGISAGKSIVNGTLTATGGTAGNALTVNDVSILGGGSVSGYGSLTVGSTGGTAGSYSVGATAFIRAGDQTIGNLALSGVGTFTVNAGSGADAFAVTPPPAGGAKLFLNANNPTVAPGDVLTLDTTGATATAIVGPIPDGSFSASNKQTVTWTGFEAVSPDSPPTITPIPDQTTASGTAVGPLGFTVTDDQTPAGSLVVTAVSSNTALIPNANITLAGTGGSRTVTLQPVTGQSGNTTITLTVTDGSGGTASTTFLVTVSAAPNAAPTISPIPDQVTASGAAVGPLNFTVTDDQTPVGSLVVTAVSSNTTLVPNASITLGGTGGGRTVTVQPAPGQTGATTITLTVTDANGASASTTFVVTVSAAPNADPAIGPIPDQTTISGSTVGPLGFTVSDDTTPAGSLVVTAVSGNTTLIPNAAITLGGTGTDRTITFASVSGQTGTAVITVTVAEAAGRTASRTFTVTVISGEVLSDNDLLLGVDRFATGSDVGSPPRATVYEATGSPAFTVVPFEAEFLGGVRVAMGDFTGDGIADLVVGTGVGRVTLVRVLDGVTKAELFSIQPFEGQFTGGVYVAAGDVTGDGFADLVITPDEGGGPRVRIFSGKGFNQVADFFGINDPDFRGGARAAVGDVNGDGTGDLVVAAGFLGGPRVATFSGKSLSSGTPTTLFNDFFAFEDTLRNGVFPAVGDLDGDGKAEVIVGGGPGGGPRVSAFDAARLLTDLYDRSANFFGGEPTDRGGSRIAVKNLNGDNRADIVVGARNGASTRVTAFLGNTIEAVGTPAAKFDFEAYPDLSGGVFVG